jgi:hypothetical protein
MANRGGTTGALALSAGSAQARTSTYVDGQGVTHSVGSPDQIPEEYRATAAPPKLRGSVIGEQPEARSPGAGGHSDALPGRCARA